MFLVGEPGLRKHHLAAQIHFGASAPAAELPLLKIDCSSVKDPIALLDDSDGSGGSGGGSDGGSGILASLQRSGGTLLLTNVHVVSVGWDGLDWKQGRGTGQSTAWTWCQCPRVSFSSYSIAVLR